MFLLNKSRIFPIQPCRFWGHYSYFSAFSKFSHFCKKLQKISHLLRGAEVATPLRFLEMVSRYNIHNETSLSMVVKVQLIASGLISPFFRGQNNEKNWLIQTQFSRYLREIQRVCDIAVNIYIRIFNTKSFFWLH